MERNILGLDIGIASVGWAIVGEESKKIKESGVNLFDSADASKNQDRRSFRGIRRNKRRKQHRLQRVDMLLNKAGFKRPENFDQEPVDIRCKGLSEKLSPKEMYIALYNLMKHRGVSYLEDLEEAKDNNSIIESIKNSQYEYPCQIQKERLEKYGFYRGTHIINGEIILNTFTVGMYEKEATQILKTQSEFYETIDEKFIEAFIKLLKTKREYYIGPGNEKSRTNYGVYKTNGETKKNLFDELRGKCSIYNGKNGMEAELRASGASYTAQYYNLLNDLCNIKVDGIKLIKKQKLEIIDYMKSQSTAKKITNVLKSLYKINPESVSGYRIDKNGKEENHSMEVYRMMKKDFSELEIDISKFSIETLDAVADILTLNTETKGMLDYFHDVDSKEYEYVKNLTDEEVNAFIEFRRKRSTLFNNWSSFSYRLIKQIVPEMLETGDEQHTCIQKMGIKKYDKFSVDKLNVDDIVDEIYNPVVVRSVRQTVKIVNELIKKYDLSKVIIEMPRDKNSDEERKNIVKMQKENEELFKKAVQFAGLDKETLDFRNHKDLALKLKCYYKQKGMCLYSGKVIDISTLVNNPYAYEIDHIIPISISFDDSQANKVLVESAENRQKSNMTPFRFLSSKSDGSWTYEQYKSKVLELYKEKLIKNKQKDLLLFEEDITKHEVVQKFISRNINDTRYASRVILNEFQRFFKDKDVKIKVINGSLTSQLRKNTLVLSKDRDLDYRHHAIDAMICCFTELSLMKYDDEFVNLDTGEIIDKDNMKDIEKESKPKYLSIAGYETRKEIERFEKNIKFSHKVDRKINRGVSNQTIYSTREYDNETYVVNKISIYDDKLVEKIKKNSDMFLMKQHDSRTWMELLKIIDTYKDVKGNPIKKYEEEYGAFRKYSKKGNGPIVKELKYLDHKMGSHIDITHNYKNTDKKVILESLKPYRSDVYYDSKKDQFNIVPIRYNDFKFENGKYILPLARYEELLKGEKLIVADETIEALEENGHIFKFSLYKNDIIELGEDEDSAEMYRFLSKNHNAKNWFEVKGIDRKFVKQTFKSTGKKVKIFNKYNVDILGNMYKVESEDLKLEFILDNKMI